MGDNGRLGRGVSWTGNELGAVTEGLGQIMEEDAVDERWLCGIITFSLYILVIYVR